MLHGTPRHGSLDRGLSEPYLRVTWQFLRFTIQELL